MKLQSKVFYKSFFISLAIFAVIAGIMITSFYMESVAVEPTKRESNILVGIQHKGSIISLLVMNCDPKNNSISFLPIPDNTLIANGEVLQNQYSTIRINKLKDAVEDIIGASINRYIIFSTDAVATITNEVGKFEYLIPYKFMYNDHEHSGPSYMNGELSKAMFTYSGYDMTKVSISEMASTYLYDFLSKHANSSGASGIAESINSTETRKMIHTNLSKEEVVQYCNFLANYQSLTHRTLALKGETHLTSSKLYFTPETYNSDKNIFK